MEGRPRYTSAVSHAKEVSNILTRLCWNISITIEFRLLEVYCLAGSCFIKNFDLFLNVCDKCAFMDQGRFVFIYEYSNYLNALP
jgi:hypothetical protein